MGIVDIPFGEQVRCTMSQVNENLIRKYQSEERIISDYYSVRDRLGKIQVLDGIVNPLTIDNRQMCPPTDNQRDIPACAGFSAITLIEAMYWKQTGKIKQLNSEQCYSLAKQLDGDRNSDGTYLEFAMNAAMQLCLKDDEFSFLEGARVGLFYNDRTDKTVETTKFLIHKFGIIQVGFNITDAWYYCNSKNYILGHSNLSLGGHAVNLVGYDRDYAYVLNQWGTEFGTKGYALMPWDTYLKELMYGAYIYGVKF